MKTKNIFIFVSVIMFIFLYTGCISFALSVADIPKHKTNVFPEDLDLQINKECSGHSYFLQADANEKGDFIVLSHKEKYDKDNNDVFKKKYVDIYGADGKFCFELVFTTTMDPALRLDKNTLYLVFYNNIVTCDIETQEINYYYIQGNKIWESTNSEIRQQEEFTVGEWTYECKRNIQLDYVKLIRSNNNQTDVLLEMPGSQSKAFYGIFFALGAVLILIGKKIVKNKRKIRKEQLL